MLLHLVFVKFPLWIFLLWDPELFHQRIQKKKKPQRVSFPLFSRHLSNCWTVWSKGVKFVHLANCQMKRARLKTAEALYTAAKNISFQCSWMNFSSCLERIHTFSLSSFYAASYISLIHKWGSSRGVNTYINYIFDTLGVRMRMVFLHPCNPPRIKNPVYCSWVYSET